MPDLIVITGPTATGKTALGVELALILGGEVVSADSMQVYRGMDIGTAKPAKAEMRGVFHHMLDVADPSENFSAAKYALLASACVDDIKSRGKTPIVVGGTGLYIDGLLRGTDFAAAPADAAIRRELEAEYDRIGGEAFRERLRKLDPDRAALLHAGDKKRLVRAREVYILTGETITEHDARSRSVPPRYTATVWALDFADRAMLYGRIDRRAAEMFENGLVEEVRALIDAGVPMDGTAMQAIGYKETALYLSGACSLSDAVAAVQQKSRQYAKRQLTWLRRDESVSWIRWKTAPELSAARRIATDFVGKTP